MPLITRVLGTCPKCKSSPYGNVSVNNNQLWQACASCGFSREYALPKIKKIVIYLDQFFLSNMFKGKANQFSHAAKKIETLAHEQLLVCPLSTIHEIETFAWDDRRKEELYNFIESVSRGHEFEQSYEIQEAQLHRAFQAFISRDQLDAVSKIVINEGVPDSVHEWDDWFFISTRPFPLDSEQIRDSKIKTGEAFVELFSDWRNDKSTFEQDYIAEIRAQAQRLWNLYWQYVISMASPDPVSFLHQPVESGFVESLLRCDDENLEPEQRIRRVMKFLNTPYFAATPWVDATARIYALLKKQVKNGSHTNREKSKKRFSGFFQDVEFIATYAPYCDAMFIDNSMYNLLSDSEGKSRTLDNVRFYSANTILEFDSFLDDIANNKEHEHASILQIINGFSIPAYSEFFENDEQS